MGADLAGVARGRTMTGCRTIQDDVRNAGAFWEDGEVVIDGNLITSRQPSDLPELIVEMRPRLSRKGGRPARRRGKSPGGRMGSRAPGPAES